MFEIQFERSRAHMGTYDQIFEILYSGDTEARINQLKPVLEVRADRIWPCIRS